MSDLISASAIEDELLECPVCLDQFNQDVRIPHRMSCCMTSICQSCLKKLLQGINLHHPLSCPMCRFRHKISNGLDSFPKERVILKILDHLKLQKRIRLSCTDCPEGSPARHQCDDCRVFLCGKCRDAHVRNVVTKLHSIVSLEEIRERPLKSFGQRQECPEHPHPFEFFCTTCSRLVCVSCTIVNHKARCSHDVVSIAEAHAKYSKSTEEVLSKLDKKKDKLQETEEKCSKSYDDFQNSVDDTKEDINATFQKLMRNLKRRRDALLNDVDVRARPVSEQTRTALDSTTELLTKVTSSTNYVRKLRSTADKLEDLQLMTSSKETLKKILEEKSEDFVNSRKGVKFHHNYIQELTNAINRAGAVSPIGSNIARC